MSEDKTTEQVDCGIVMPISAFADYGPGHWPEVRDVIERAVTEANMKAIPVWEHSNTDIIQGRIVKNIYDLPIVVCDVSGLNPNVMFELGLRLAFKKPVVLIVDQMTKIPFDTNSIQHLIYDKSLHYQKTEKFISDLCERLISVYEASKEPDYQAFIDTFGTFTSFEPNPLKVEINQYLVDRLDDLSGVLSVVRSEQRMFREILSIQSPPFPVSETPKNALSGLVNGTNFYEYNGYWTDDRTTALANMWAKGLTASEIAEALGGISKNAVIGKAHRLGLKSRPSTVKKS